MKTLGFTIMAAVASVGALQACGEDDPCFVTGTRVLTPGGWRRIEDLMAEDEVWSFDLARGEPVVRRIVRVMRSVAPEIARLEAGELAIHGATVSHPFWDAASSEFVRLDALSLDSRVLAWLGSSDARELQVTAIARVHSRGGVEVFNLEVEGPEHNYFAEGILVHNKSVTPNNCTTRGDCPPCPAVGPGTEEPCPEESMVCPFPAGACDEELSFRCNGTKYPWSPYGGSTYCAPCPPNTALLDPDRCAVHPTMHCVLPDPAACAGHVLARCNQDWELQPDFFCNPASCPTSATADAPCTGEGDTCAYPEATPCGLQDAVWQCTGGKLAPIVVPLCPSPG